MYLQLDTQFNPFTYDEMVKPLLYYKDAYDKTESSYADLVTQTEAWKDIVNRTNSPEAYSMYKSYADRLNSIVDDFSRGMTADNRRALLGMKRGYAQSIVPIATAAKRREALAEEQRKARATNPTIIYQRDMASTSLDDFINNPSLDYGASYSGALLTQQVAQAATNLKTVMTDKSKLKSLGLPYQYEQALQYGYSPDQVLAAMARDPKAAPILTKLVDDVIESSGMPKWASPAQMAQAIAFANQGLYNAIGKTEYKNYVDQFGMQDALNARQHARAVAAQRAAQQQAARHQGARLNPVALRSQQQVSKMAQERDKWIKAGYFILKDGKYVLTKKGEQEYKKIITKGGTAKSVPSAPGVFIKDPGTAGYHTDFYNFVNDILFAGSNYKPYINKAKQLVTTGDSIGRRFTNYAKQADPSSYDTYHSTEYVRQVSGDYANTMQTQILARQPGTGFYNLDFDGKNGWKQGDKIDSEKLAKSKLASVNYSKYGTTAIFVGEDGKNYRVKVPGESINPTVNTNVQSSISNADMYGEIVAKGYQPKMYHDSAGNLRVSRDNNGNIIYTDTPLTQADMLTLEGYQREALDEMSMYGSQYVVPSTTESEKYNSFDF